MKKGLISIARLYKELFLVLKKNTASQNKKKIGKRCKQAFNNKKDSQKKAAKTKT